MALLQVVDPKYAIIEAKATTGAARTTNKYVASKLGVLSEKYKGKPVIQMDHYWILQRLRIELTKLSNDIRADFKVGVTSDNLHKLYTRHIIVISLLGDLGLYECIIAYQ